MYKLSNRDRSFLPTYCACLLPVYIRPSTLHPQAAVKWKGEVESCQNSSVSLHLKQKQQPPFADRRHLLPMDVPIHVQIAHLGDWGWGDGGVTLFI